MSLSGSLNFARQIDRHGGITRIEGPVLQSPRRGGRAVAVRHRDINGINGTRRHDDAGSRVAVDSSRLDVESGTGHAREEL